MTWREHIGLVAFSLVFGAICGAYYRDVFAAIIGASIAFISIYQSERQRIRLRRY